MDGSANVANAPETSVEAIFAKDTWSREDAQRLYEALFAMRNAADQFRARVADLQARNPDATGAVALKLGIAQYMLGDFPAALATLAGATDNRDRHWYQAQSYRQLEQYDKAIEEFQRAQDRGFDERSCRIAAAQCEALAGRIDQARKAADALASKSGEVAEYQVLRGLIHQVQGDLDAAEEAYGEALDLEPRNPAAAFRLAFLYDMYGDEGQAMELYTTALRTPPVNAHALMNLAVLYEDQGQWELAERCLLAVLAVRPDHPRARLYLKDVQSSRSMYYDEDLERRTTQRNAVLDIPVTDFELSVRARNCLKKMEIRTLGDLLRISEAELLAYKNFGETSLAEIKAMLAQKGLRLGQDLEQKAPPKARTPGPEVATVDNEGVLATPMADLELSVRSRKALQRLNVGTLGELAGRSEAELLACKNFGQTSLNEIKQRLAEYGLSLRDRR